MEQLHLKGYLEIDSDGNVVLTNRDTPKYVNGEIIVAECVVQFADDIKGGTVHHTEDNLGEDRAAIENVNLRIYVTDKECTLERAMTALVDKIEGSCVAETSLYGYSEFTVMGLDVDSFTVGNHDIEEILKSHEGKYVHFVMEC